MQEYLVDAIVLDVEPQKDFDNRFALFTERYGKLLANGTSTRKITSKLIGHLQPGFVSAIRLVERRGLRLADALARGKIAAPPPKLCFLNQLLHEGEPEQEVWRLLMSGDTNGDFSWMRMLAALGWDPARAACARCGLPPELFHIESQEFFCAACARGASQARENELLYL